MNFGADRLRTAIMEIGTITKGINNPILKTYFAYQGPRKSYNGQIPENSKENSNDILVNLLI